MNYNWQNCHCEYLYILRASSKFNQIYAKKYFWLQTEQRTLYDEIRMNVQWYKMGEHRTRIKELSMKNPLREETKNIRKMTKLSTTTRMKPEKEKGPERFFSA